jgi:hypothetical protein
LKSLLEFKCEDRIGTNPDVAASIVWHVVKKAGDQKLHVTEVRIAIRSVFVEIEVPDELSRFDADAYSRVVGEQLKDAVVEGARVATTLSRRTDEGRGEAILVGHATSSPIR